MIHKWPKKGKRELFREVRPFENLFNRPPLLEMSPIFLALGQYYLKQVLRKTVDQIFDIFLVPRKRVFENRAVLQTSQKPPPGQICSPPQPKSVQLRSKLAGLLSRPSYSSLLIRFPLKRKKVLKKNL